MDNLNLIKDRINQDIDPAGAPNSILAINHNEIEQSILSSTGKYVGSCYTAVKTATIFNSGVFSWEGNAMNNVADFTIKVSKKTTDLNDFGVLLNTLVETDIIQFKDFAGRCIYLVFKSFSTGTDGSGNDIYNIVVAGLADNPNYVYQTNENQICILSLCKQIVPVTGFVPAGGYAGSGQDLKDEIDTKLNIADYNDRWKGKYTSYALLISAHPTANAGDYAQVDEGSGFDVINYNYDLEDGWIDGGSGSSATNTDMLPEGSSNLYWTTARGLALVLSGLTASAGTFTSSDTLITAFGKIKYLIDNIASIYQVILTDVNFGAFINGLTAKTTPIDADYALYMDSADSNKAKKVSWLNIKATLKAYFDTFYLVPQITITLTGNITTATTDASGYGQNGRHNLLDNGATARNLTCNGGVTASYGRIGTGTITFVQGSGRTLVQLAGTNVLNGIAGSTATLWSNGTTDYLLITNY